MNNEQAFREFLAGREAAGLSPRTIGFYHYGLDKFVKAYPEVPEGPRELEAYLGTLRHLAPESRHGIWRALRTYYLWLGNRHGLPNAARSVLRPRCPKPRPKALTEGEVRSILAQPMSRRDRAMILLLLDTGMRLGELHNLTRSKIGSQTVLVSGKTGEREVPISPNAARALIGVNLPWSGPKGPLTLNGLYLAIRRITRAAGIQRGGPHSLRHTFGRHYVLAGGDVFSLQRIMGHQDIATTKLYVDMDTRDLCRQHERFALLANLGEQSG